MDRTLRRVAITLTLVALVFALSLAQASAATKQNFRIAWSIYVGWMPWGFAQDSGIIKKWADKYGISIDIVQINDYVESINQYTAGGFDGCVMTNMDALTIPAAGGVDSTALIVGDFSNGNDGLVLKNGAKLGDVKGRKVYLVELSVSHYLLARALERAKLTERDITTVNTSDADIVAAFSGSKDVTAAVTWNPQLTEIRKVPGSAEVFSSADIPGEIIDLMVVNTAALAANPQLGKALTGAWYEIMALMASDTPQGTTAREAMAKAAGTNLAGFDSQLKTTRMFYKPAEAAAFTASPELVATMERVRQFSFTHGLLGDNAKSAEAIGIAFPGGKVTGAAKNVKLRFNADFMEMAAQGKL